MIRPLLANFGLAALAAALFAGSFPNPVAENGLPFLAWVAYAPVFFLLYRVSLGASALWGALYGYAAYLLFNYWLADFHPAAGLVVHGFYMLFMALLFFALRLAVEFFPRRAYIAHWAIWLAYEYVRTLGFLGYPYGITGYTQWRMIPLIQIADIFGVWGVSALVVFPSAWLGAALGLGSRRGRGLLPAASARPPLSALRRALFDVKVFFRRERASALAWLAALAAALLYGAAAPSDFSGKPHASIALIQHNTDPWIGGADAFRRNFEALARLSGEALAAHPRPDLVAWSETAFVPRIHWHSAYRESREMWLLVRDLLDYMALQDVPFVIGNHDGRRGPGGRVFDFNAALLFEGGQVAGVYRKMRLVPFTEHFPFAERFPRVYRALREADTHFWDAGEEPTVFYASGFRFSTPICFEDSFGYISRRFVLAGADVLVNMSNKAWAGSLSSQNQQLAMSVFRAVENRRSMVRATSSGQTAGIAPDGRIVAMAPPFEEAWVTATVPVVRGRWTLYTRFGDFFGAAFALAAAPLLIIGGASCIIGKARRGAASAGQTPGAGAGSSAKAAARTGKPPQRRKR